MNELAIYLRDRSAMRGLFSRVELLDDSGAPLFQVADPTEAPASVKPTEKDWAAAKAGEINVREDADGAIRRGHVLAAGGIVDATAGAGRPGRCAGRSRSAGR